MVDWYHGMTINMCLQWHFIQCVLVASFNQCTSVTDTYTCTCFNGFSLVYEEYDQVELLIDGGPFFDVGTEAVIRCHYTGLIVIEYPDFIINGKMYDSAKLETELSQYKHQYTTGVEGPYIWANYSLTLPMVQPSDNGTTYQCILVPFDGMGRYHSNIATLYVKGEVAYSAEADQ